MNLSRLRKLKYALPLAALVMACTATASTAKPTSASAEKSPIKVAILSDCKGAFAAFYGADVGGAIMAFVELTGAKVVNKNDPLKGMKGGAINGHPIKIVGIGCSNDTADLALSETKRLMEKQKADVMIGPLSGDEGVAVAKYAKLHPTKTFVNGTSGALDTTMIVRAPNFFRWNADGAQWNAGTGEIAYKKLGWRKAAIIMDDYSFGWTSAAGLIADFCAVGGQITKRVYPPLNTTDYSSYVQQLPPPDTIDGTFWVVGGTGTAASLTAYEQAYGKLDPKKNIGNLFFAFLGADKVVGPKVVGSYVGGFGTGPGLKTAQAKTYEKVVARWYPGLNGGNYADGFVYNYFNAAWALVQGLTHSNGAVGAALQKGLPRQLRAGYQVSSGGLVKLDSNRQAIQDQYPLQVIKNADGSIGTAIVGFVPNVDQSFAGLFKKSSPPPGRTQPPCVKKSTPWQGKIKVVKNGVITQAVIK